MPKSLRDLKQDFAETQTAWETKMNAKAPIEEIREAFEAMKETRALLEMQEQAEKMVVLEKREDVKPQIEQRDLTNEEVEVAYKDVFLKAVRNKELNKNDMNIFERMKEIRDVPTATPYLSSASDTDGGLIVPKDVQTRINEYKRQYAFELQSLVDVERVTAPTGLRVFEKLADSVAFVNIDEWETIGEVAAPQFEKKEYSLAQYAGILPIPRNLLQDTDAALMDTIAKFIARKTIVTRNAQILAKINESYTVKKALAGVDDFKDVLNVELDAVFANNAKIITNQDGFNVLDKLKDENGNYLLQPDVKSPTGKALLGKAVVLVPNRELPSALGKAPVYIGDMKEAIKFFDRGVYEITSTEIGGNAFTRNSMDIRVIDRFGVEAWDTAAVIAGELTVPAGV